MPLPTTEKVHVVDSLFPRTYTKSSLGISLTDAELDERTILLNSWLGELVGEFSSLSFPVQKLVQVGGVVKPICITCISRVYQAHILNAVLYYTPLYTCDTSHSLGMHYTCTLPLHI